MSTLGIDLHLDRLRRLAPFRERRDLVAGLDLVNRLIVRRAVRLGAADDPDIGRRRVDPLVILGSLNSSIAAVQPGGVTRKLPACVPVVRQPGEANTSVHMSSIGRR